MTRQMIEITFGNALTQARQLEACADEMTNLANRRLSEIQSDIQSAWQGDGVSAYIDKVNQTGEGLRVTANKLYRIAETIRNAARIFRETELKALEIAQQRTY